MQKNKLPNATNAAGFTLVEVVIGMTLMAMVFTASYGAYFLGVRIVQDAREELRASQIIQSELESMRTLTWLDLEGMASTSTIDPQGEFVKVFAKDFTTTREIIDLSNSQKKVKITIEWTNARGQKRTQVFNTVFTKFGLNDYYYRQV